MGKVYIKFKSEDPIANSEQGTESRLTRLVTNSLETLLTSILPKANPDFEGKILDVSEWILEVDDVEGTPEREIGLNEKGKVMMIMPWRDNCGFWTDSAVKVDELAKGRAMTFVDKAEFERLWSSFDQ